jgi:YjbE family integral membrane protein
MEFLGAGWWYALATIIVIDLVLAGDNALVIGMAASRLRPDLRRRAILWGSAGAIVVRAAMALVVVWLLQIPGLLLLGGALLLPIAYRLAVPASGGDSHGEHEAATSFWGAMKTIVVADALMGLDNVLAIGGAAGGRWELVVIGLVITVPMIIYGSGWVAKAIERWPVLTAAGASVLALTAAGMIVKDPLFDRFVVDHNLADWSIKGAVAASMFLIGWRSLRTSPRSAR